MNRGEVLLFKTFDSALDGRTPFLPHSSCRVPRSPHHAPARESLATPGFLLKRRPLVRRAADKECNSLQFRPPPRHGSVRPDSR